MGEARDRGKWGEPTNVQRHEREGPEDGREGPEDGRGSDMDNAQVKGLVVNTMTGFEMLSSTTI